MKPSRQTKAPSDTYSATAWRIDITFDLIEGTIETKMVLFLAAEATFSTGSEFIVDGGALLGPVMDLEQAEG